MTRLTTRAALCVLLALAAACGGSDPPARTALGAAPAPTPGRSADTPVPPVAPSDDAGAEAADASEPETADARYQIPLGASPSRGPSTALVTIVEFADYQCPFCARAEETLRDLRARYGDGIRLVFKDAPLPFHAQADPAAEAALEVRAESGDAAFWAMHDALFAHQRELDAETIVRLGTAARARPEKLRAAMAQRSHASEIQADEDVADDFDADGTPYFFIDGRPLVGAQPAEQFVAIIDQEMKAARALLAAGTPPSALYDVLLKDARKPPEPERRDVAPLPSGDPARGPSTAKVTVHEFADFECPFCVRAEPVLLELEAAYADRVRLVWHDLPMPFHAGAAPAARAAREAQSQGGDRAFWQFHDRLLSEHGGLSRADLDGDARLLGLNMARWGAALDARAHQGDLDADLRAAEAMGIDGTPSFVVVPAGSRAGYLVVGAQPFAKFHKLVERALGEAR